MEMEVDVLALQSLTSPSELSSELAGMGGNTCVFTNVCGIATVAVNVCCNTINCNNTVCVGTVIVKL